MLGTGATDFFCTSVERGSSALIKLLRNPGATVLVLGLLVAALVFAIVKATWTPVAPFRVSRRRAWGQILSGSARMYVGHLRLFLGLGVLLIPVVLAITVLQWLLLQLADAFGSVTGDLAGLVTYLSLVVGLLLTLGAFGVVQTATARALVELDGGRKVNAADAYRFALRRLGPLLATVAVVSLIWVALTTTGFLIPVAIWLAVRWSLLAQVVELDDLSRRAALRRSGELVRGHWIRVGSLVGLSTAIALVAGPLVGALLIFASNSSLALLNLVAGVVYALTLPYVALVTTFVYMDVRTRHELDAEEVPRELPAEIAV